MANALQTPAGYAELLQELKTRIHAAQVRAAQAVSHELVLLYWSIGREIFARQQAEGWGGKIIDRLAHDLQNEFPGIEGFSSRSLKYMRALAEAWPEESIVQQLIAQLPWGHKTKLPESVLLATAKQSLVCAEDLPGRCVWSPGRKSTPRKTGTAWLPQRQQRVRASKRKQLT